MRLGTKILLLTLAITLGLSGLVAWSVTSEITRYETARARTEIERAIAGFDDRLNFEQGRIANAVSSQMDDSQNRSQLQPLEEGDDESRLSVRTNIEQYVFGDVIASELGASGGAPAFQALLNERGTLLVAYSADSGLSAALRTQRIEWPVAQALDTDARTRRYVLVAARLYIIFAVPVRQI
ncbi:MAG: hypothetical protein ACREJC_12135, partial [Tepidisphaeraceae bacterium]